MDHALERFDLLGPPWEEAETLHIVRSEPHPLPWDERPTAILPEPWHDAGPPAIPGHLRTVRPRQLVISRPARVLVLPEPEPDARHPYDPREAEWFTGVREAQRREESMPLWSLVLTGSVGLILAAGLGLLVILT